MLKFILSRAALILVSFTLAVLATACNKGEPTADTSSDEQYIPTEKNVATPTPSTATTAVKQVIPQQEPVRRQLTEIELSYFEQGLDKAVGAFSISQSAQSREDWNLVASQLQDAIALMKKVPVESNYFTSAQAKILEYQRQLKYALTQATRPVDPPSLSSGNIVVVPQVTTAPESIIEYKKTPITEKLTQPTSKPPVVLVKPEKPFSVPIPVKQPKELPVYTATIKRRIGGTPIIEVTFNGNQRFEMILDTGASGTVITQNMADALGVIPVTKAKANTASAKAVEFPVGYVDSIEVGGARANQVAVAIAGTELEMGLLGHDFFGNYDITIKRNLVEFRPQSYLHSPINTPEPKITPPMFTEPQSIDIPEPN